MMTLNLVYFKKPKNKVLTELINGKYRVKSQA